MIFLLTVAQDSVAPGVAQDSAVPGSVTQEFINEIETDPPPMLSFRTTASSTDQSLGEDDDSLPGEHKDLLDEYVKIKEETEEIPTWLSLWNGDAPQPYVYSQNMEALEGRIKQVLQRFTDLQLDHYKPEQDLLKARLENVIFAKHDVGQQAFKAGIRAGSGQQCEQSIDYQVFKLFNSMHTVMNGEMQGNIFEKLSVYRTIQTESIRLMGLLSFTQLELAKASAEFNAFFNTVS